MQTKHVVYVHKCISVGSLSVFMWTVLTGNARLVYVVSSPRLCVSELHLCTRNLAVLSGKIKRFKKILQDTADISITLSLPSEKTKRFDNERFHVEALTRRRVQQTRRRSDANFVCQEILQHMFLETRPRTHYKESQVITWQHTTQVRTYFIVKTGLEEEL